jgi:chemotaxis protein methyltransferase CheR
MADPAPRTNGAEPKRDLEHVEMDLLLEGVYRHYGFDFRGYARGSIRRRLMRRMWGENVTTISALQEKILHEPAAMERLLYDLSVSVTSMFRDPSFFSALREKVVPILRTYPFIRIWNAGCSTGEETFSLAILLEEEGLYDRARIYATDINDIVLERARSGAFPLDRMRDYTENYIKSGGTRAFSEYYSARDRWARFGEGLERNIVFAQHNLVSDRAFNDFHMIVCRNVLIYFNCDLQSRVHELFYESLVNFGVLALGTKESVKFAPIEDHYEDLDEKEKIFKKVS